MKKFFYLFALSAFVFTACNDKEEDNGGGNGGGNGSDAIRKISVKATEINDLPTSGIEEIRAVVYNPDYVVASQKWENGFEIELPETIPANYLKSAKGYYQGSSDENGTLTFSSDAKIALLDLEVYGKEDKYLEDLTYGKIISDNKTVYVEYVYSDMDCNIKGALIWEYGDNGDGQPAGYDKETYNLSLKKGWNRVATTWTYTEKGNIDEMEFSTTLPSGLSWRYGSFDVEED